MERGESRLRRLLGTLGYAVDPEDVLRPGQPRLDLLEELFDRWHRWGAASARGTQMWAALPGGPLPADATRGESADLASSRTLHLLRRAAALGLCDPDDSSVVDGTGPPGQSLTLLVVLAEMVVTQEARPKRQSLQADEEADLTLLELVAREDLDETFSTSCSLLPADMMSTVGATAAVDESTVALYESEIAALLEQVPPTPDQIGGDEGGGGGSGGGRDMAAPPPPSEHQLKSASLYLETVAQQAEDVVRLCVGRFSEPPRNTGSRESRGVAGRGAGAAVATLAELERVVSDIERVRDNLAYLQSRKVA